MCATKKRAPCKKTQIKNRKNTNFTIKFYGTHLFFQTKALSHLKENLKMSHSFIYTSIRFKQKSSYVRKCKIRNYRI